MCCCLGTRHLDIVQSKRQWKIRDVMFPFFSARIVLCCFLKIDRTKCQWVKIKKNKTKKGTETPFHLQSTVAAAAITARISFASGCRVQRTRNPHGGYSYLGAGGSKERTWCSEPAKCEVAVCMFPECFKGCTCHPIRTLTVRNLNIICGNCFSRKDGLQ